MPTLNLPQITKPVREEYIRLLETIALSYGVSPENISQLLNVARWQDNPRVNKGRPLSFNLKVEKEFPIRIETISPGRVFELSGQSDRNKTTSLIYLATLLGINWDVTRPFLDRDDRVFTVATKYIVPSIAQGQKVELVVNSDSYQLSISLEDGKAFISLVDNNRNPIEEFNSKIVSLVSVEDWSAYQQIMSRICNIQFVGKSRDFVGQVSIEESKDLAWLCSQVITRVGQLQVYLQSLPRDQVYGFTEQELSIEKAGLTQKIKEIRSEIDILDSKLSSFHKQIQGTQEFIAIRQQLDSDPSTAIKSVVRGLQLQETTRDHDKRRIELQRNIDSLKNDISRLSKQVSQQEPILNNIKVSIDALRDKIVQNLALLSSLNNHASQTIRHISNRDYDSLINFCNYAFITNMTVSLLDDLLGIIGPFDKSLIIPFELNDIPGMKLVEFERRLTAAKNLSSDIQILNPELLNAFNVFHAAGITTGQEFRRLESTLETDISLLKDKQKIYEERSSELSVTESVLKNLLGNDDLPSLKSKTAQQIQDLTTEERGKIERIHLLAQDLGYHRPWLIEVSQLESSIRESRTQIRKFEEARNDKEAGEDLLRKRLIDIQHSDPRTNTGRLQPDALLEMQEVLGFISSYLDNYQRSREGLQSYNNTTLNKLEENLGDNRQKVHTTLNRVIRQRCPVMYKNRASGPVRLDVEDYDFITGEKNISGLQEGEWAGGGGDSAMTVLGLASHASGSHIGTVLLVDEFNDAETFKQVVCDDLAALAQLAFAIFVKQDPDQLTVQLKPLTEV